MEKSQLEKFVNQGLSTYDIAKTVGKGQTTIRYWLAKHNLGTKRVYRCQCGEINLEKFFKGRYTQCKKCRRYEQNKRHRATKLKLVAYRGGKCILCGYSKCMASLDFHHLDPSKKDPNWKKMKNWTFERVKKEVEKCDVICRNCHGELHYQDIA